MGVHIDQPLYLVEQGIKEFYQDFIYPPTGEATSSSRLFIVCDGSGGPGKGEIASRLAAQIVSNYILGLQSAPSNKHLESALKSVELTFSSYITTHTHALGMNTTLSLVYIDENEIIFAYVGNSPIIYYKKRKVNITATVPMRDKGIGANMRELLNKRIVGEESPVSLSILRIPIQEIEAGDLIVLSTDGLYEALNNESDFYTLFSTTADNLSTLANTLQAFIGKNNGDNTSCYILPIRSVSDVSPNPENSYRDAGHSPASNAKDTDTMSTGTDNLAGEEASESQKPFFQRKNALLITGISTLGLIGLVLLYLLVFNRKPSKSADQLVQEGQAFLKQGNYERALSSLDSAMNLIKDSNYKVEVRRIRESANAQYQDSRLNTEQLLSTANKYFTDKDYENALRYFIRARNGAEKDKITLADSVLERMIFSHIQLGNSLLSSTPDKSIEHYNAALSLETPTLKKALQKEPYYIEAQKSLATLSKAKDNSGIASRGIVTVETATPGSKSASRQNESPQASVSSSGAAKVSRSSGESVSASRPNASQKQAYVKGLRLFEKAKGTQSQYEFKAAAQSLERSGPALDGKGAYILSYLYHNGLGVKADKKKALTYAKKASDKQWPSGQYMYAHLLLERKNHADTVTAIKLLKSSAGTMYSESITRLRELGID